jgi:hypothetical protein
MLLAGVQLPLDLEFADLPLVDDDAFEEGPFELDGD